MQSYDATPSSPQVLAVTLLQNSQVIHGPLDMHDSWEGNCKLWEHTACSHEITSAVAKQHISIVSNKQDDQNCFLYYQSVGLSLKLQILLAVVYAVRYLRMSKQWEAYVIPRCCCIGERDEKTCYFHLALQIFRQDWFTCVFVYHLRHLKCHI